LQKSVGAQASSTSFGINGVGSVASYSGGWNTVSSSKITNDISEMIEHGAYGAAVAALRSLREMQPYESSGSGACPSLNDYRPKLGALQRWVREIDAAGTDDPLALEVLDAMLRVVAPEAILSVDKADSARASWAKLGVGMGVDDNIDINSQRGRLRLFPAFTCKGFDGDESDMKLTSQLPDQDNIDVFDRLVSTMVCGSDGIRRISNPDSSNVKREDCFRVCGHENGPDRKPPNKYDLSLITTSVSNEQQLQSNKEERTTIASCSILLKRDTTNTPIKKTPIPYVHDSFLLENVLSPTECDRLIAAAEMAGYYPDEPLAGQPGASILAHACVWVVDHEMERTIFDRVKGFLPSYKEHQTNPIRCDKEEEETLLPLGINRRFRFYRYVPGRYYRPHIDGAWPSSGFDVKGEYRYDINDIDNKNGTQFVQSADGKGDKVKDGEQASQEGSSRRQLSRLTFLIYLNDDFDGGNTTFFIPEKDQEGVLNAFPVKPVRGCVLVFPHGTCGK
jgi:hypothetical protein